MPPTHGEPHPFAEERRLFYVALTRARKGVYLITGAARPSPFVRELVKNSREVKCRDGLTPQCPACTRGSLTPSQSGDNLRCSNFPRCQHLRPRCSGCRRGYAELNADRSAVECSNPHCDKPPAICPKCRSGVLVLRTGQSRFWGCSRYQATPSCNFTQPAPEQAGTAPGPGSQPARGRRGRRRIRYGPRR